jgi:hypothetical protein
MLYSAITLFALFSNMTLILRPAQFHFRPSFHAVFVYFLRGSTFGLCKGDIGLQIKSLSQAFNTGI